MNSQEIATAVSLLLQAASGLQGVAAKFNQANAEGRDITEAEKAEAAKASAAAIDALSAMP